MVIALLLTALSLLAYAPSAVRADSSVAYQIDATHSGNIITPGVGNPFVQKWTKALVGGSASYALQANSRVFVIAGNAGTGAANLYALSAINGNTLWGPTAVGSATPGATSLAYDGAQVYTLNAAGVVNAYNESTGGLAWTSTLTGATVFNAAPTAAGGTLFITGDAPATIYAINEGTGAVSNSTTAITGIPGSPAVTGAGVFTDTGTDIFAHSLSLASQLWTTPTAGGTAPGTTAVAGSTQLFTHNPGAGGATYDLGTGAAGFLLSNTPATAPARDGTNVYYVSGGTLFADNASTGLNVWSSGAATYTAAPIVVNGVIFAADLAGVIHQFNSAGTPVGSPITAPSAISAPNESGAAILTGLTAAQGELLVPNGVNLTAYASTDVTPPVTTASGILPNGTSTTNVTITLSATDAGSGVASTFYIIDGGGTLTYSGPFTINATTNPGSHVVKFWSVDVAGNVETQHSLPFTILPTLTTLAPNNALVGSAALVMTVTGTNFVAGATVSFAGVTLTPSAITSTSITVTVPAAQLSTAGIKAVTVSNAAGGTSTPAVNFTVNNAVPTITSLAPNQAFAGRPAFTMQVNGSGFLNGAVVRWNGSSRTTTFINGNTLTAAITAADIAGPAGSIVPVTVLNPAPTTGASAASNFTVLVNPAPVVTTMTPTSAFAGGGAFTLTVNGTGNTFVSGNSVVNWNGSPRPTTFVNANQLTAAIPATDIVAIGTASVTVVTTPTGGTSAALTFTINGAGVNNLSLVPNPVVGGITNSVGTVTLQAAATVATTVNLTNGTPAAASIPASIVIPIGQSTGTFPITSIGVPATTNDIIGAAVVGQSPAITRTLVVNTQLASVSLNPTSVAGSSQTVCTGTVTLRAAAPAGGISVTVASGTPSVATIVGSPVLVAAGSTTGTFTVTTTEVAANTNVVITATDPAGATATATLTVTPLLQSLAIAPGSVVGGFANATGTITLRGPAPVGGTLVNVISNNNNAGFPPPTVATTVTVPAGATTATFTIFTRGVGANVTPTITATRNTVNATATFTITRPMISFTLAPTSVVGGSGVPQQQSVGTITFVSATPAGGVTVNLATSDPTHTSLPASILVPAGVTTATFTIDTAVVTTTTTATITVTMGSQNLTAPLTITPLASGFVFSPTSVGGGLANSVGTITLGQPALVDTTVNLTVTVGATAVTIPSSTTILAGTTTGTFTAVTNAVTASTLVTVQASIFAQNISANLTVLPPMASISVSPGTVVGGFVNPTITVTLTGPAPVGGKVVTVTSSNLNAGFPAPAPLTTTVTVPAGSTSTTLPITTQGVGATVTSTLTATAGNSVTTTLTLTRPIATFTIAPTSVVGSLANSVGTVTLNSAAPAGGFVVTTTSSVPAAASVGASLTIPAGATSGTFPITSAVVAASTAVTITAKNGSNILTQTLTVLPLGGGLALSPNPVGGGLANSTGTVTLGGPAAVDTLVTLTSGNAHAIVPANITILAGTSSQTFTITTTEVTVSTPALITATIGAQNLTATLTILPVLASVTINPTSVFGGLANATGTITLNGNADVNRTFNLTSNNINVTVPATAVVLAGTSSITFPITTQGVFGTITASITAALSTAVTETASANLTVNRPISGYTLTPGSVVGGQQTATGTITLAAPAPVGGAAIVITSSNHTAAADPFPAGTPLVIGAGLNTATFTVTTLNVTTSQTTGIQLHFGTDLPSINLTVTPFTAGLSLNPGTVVGGMQNSIGTITLPAPAPVDTPFNLTSSNTAWATVPPSVTITAGSSSTTFNITTFGVGSTVTATISATNTLSSVVSTANLALTRAITNFTLTPTSVVGGAASSVGALTLAIPAPAGGTSITVTSTNNTATNIPVGGVTVVIPAGSSTGSFTVGTNVVAATVTANIRASLGTDQPNINLTITPIGGSLSLAPTSVVGSYTDSVGTVTLTGPAPAGGVLVTLTSGTPTLATVPASVTVAAGATTATFPVNTTAIGPSAAVATSTPITITGLVGGAGGQTITATLTDLPLLASVALAPNSVFGGLANSTATVTLNTAAPAGGVNVNLNSSNLNAGFPIGTQNTTVAIAAGATTGTATIITQGVFATVTSTITASLAGSNNVTATLTINRPITNFTLTPTSVVGGAQNSIAAVTIAAAAPAGGTTINLTSSNTVAATVPATLVIPAGSTSGTFTVTSNVVGATATSTIQLHFGTDLPSLVLTVTPIVGSITLSPTSVVGSFTDSVGTVTLAAAAPAGGVIVTLTSGTPTLATVPASVTVLAGATTATFPVNTTAIGPSAEVTASTAITISGTVGSQTVTATLTDLPLLASISLSPNTVFGGLANSTATVTLNTAAPAGGVSVQPGNPTANVNVTVPGAPFTIAAGATTGTFPVTTQGVFGTISVPITATTHGRTVTANLTLNRPITGYTLAPATICGTLTTATGTITLAAAAPAGGALIQVISSDHTVAPDPGPVTIAAGLTTGTFTVAALENTTAANKTVAIQLQFGTDLPSITLTVTPILASVTLNPGTVAGGVQNSTGTITLNGPAPALGEAVAVVSSNPNAGFPIGTQTTTVTVPAGATTATFTITTQSVSATVTSTITATLHTVARTATLTINPPLSNFAIAPGTVMGGVQNAIGTITLAAAAPAGGTVVTVTDSDSVATSVPATVTVLAGATTATFTVTTTQILPPNITATISVKIGSNAGTQVRTATVTVVPVLTSVAVNPTSVKGGTANSTGTVTLGTAAPAGGVVVGLSASDPSGTVPATVTVAAGATTATFTVTTSVVAVNTTDTITASYPSGGGGQSVTTNLTVTP